MDDIMSRQVVYQIPCMDKAQVRAGITYKAVEDGDLKLDIYLPPDLPPGERRPVVLCTHGEPWTTEAVRFDALATGQYVSWGRLVAASGWIGVPFEHRNSRALTALPEVASDLDDLITFVRTRVPEADPDRLILWVCSDGGAYGLRAAIRHATYVRCAVIYYTFLEPLYYREIIAPEVSDEALREYAPITVLGQEGVTIPPLLIARAGKDNPELNETIDCFAAEALRQNVLLDLLNYAGGQHGFETLDDTERARYIIQQTLAFTRLHASARESTSALNSRRSAPCPSPRLSPPRRARKNDASTRSLSPRWPGRPSVPLRHSSSSPSGQTLVRLPARLVL
jgi:acetyl esterase/lipase